MVAGLIWLGPALAHDKEEVLSLSVTNYTGYVIASDSQQGAPEYDRDAIRASTQVKFTTLGDIAVTYQYQVVFKLLDSTGTAVPILDAQGKTNTSYIVVDSDVTLPFTIFGFTFKTSTRNYGAPLRPTVRLDQFEQYHVQVSLNQKLPAGRLYTSTGVSADDVPRGYFHFTSVDSADAALNVIGTLESSLYTRTFLVNTIPGKETLQVSAGFKLRRYDGFTIFPTTDNVTVHLDFELLDAATDAPVPLQSNRKTVVKPVQSHGITLVGNPIPPTVTSFTETLDLKPSGQLDSVGHLYKVRVKLSHVEVLLSPPVEANSLTLANRRMLHFNGRLLFGPIETQFGSIANTPVPGVVTPTGVPTGLMVDGNSGFVIGKPDHTYGDGSSLGVFLRVNGDADYAGVGPVVLSAPSPDTNTLNQVTFERVVTQLSSSGAKADLKVNLPTGFGYREDMTSRILKSQFPFTGVELTQALEPTGDLTYPDLIYGCEETKPFWIEAKPTVWEIGAGRFVLGATSGVKYVRGDELAALAAAPVAKASMKRKRSNEQFYNFLEKITSSKVIVEANASGVALMSLEATLTPGVFVTHFPYDVPIRFASGGQILIEQDLFNSSKSVLAGLSPLKVSYARDCAEPVCGPGKGPDDLTLDPQDKELYFTRDGGLTQPGKITVPKPLTWGWIDEPSIQQFAQQVEAFTEGVFHMPGCFLQGGQTALGVLQRPGVLLFTGVGPDDPGKVERFGTPAYQEGLGDYGGLNFRVVTDGAKKGRSVIGGKDTGEYPLEGRSKYYVRKAGVSGIHEAVFGEFPKTAKLYGYDFTFSNYGLAYLDSENVDSRTEGSVAVKYPSDIVQNFEELKFSCIGALEDAKVPGSEAGLMKLLKFWEADFSTLAIRFDRKDGAQCDPGEGFLTLGVEAYAQHVDAKLFGTLGFHPTGNLITRADAVLDPPFDSRLKLPNYFKLKGPKTEKYTFTPVNDAYYNNWDFYKTEPGFINLAGKMDVPFFEDLKVHMHTSADKDGDTAPIYLMGGWPNKGFEAPAGKHFFNLNPADPDNRGFPADTTVDGYHKGNTDNAQKYLVRAQRNWLGVVDLDYPMKWSSSTRAFTAFEAVQNDLLVLTVKHEAKYLSADNAELVFGAQYEGLPQINLANLAFDQLSGVADAVNGAIGNASRQAIDEGMKRLNEMMDDQVKKFYDQAFNSLVDPVIDALYDDLKADYLANAGHFGAGNPGNLIAGYITGGGNSVVNRLKGIVDGAGAGQMDVLKQLDGNLTQVEDALAQIENLLQKAPDGSRQLVTKLVQELVGDFAAQFAGAFADEKLKPFLEKVNPSLDEILGVLGDLKSVVSDLRSKLAAGQEVANELKAKLNSLSAEVDTAANKIRNDVNSIFAGFDPNIDNPFADMSKEDLKALIRQKVEDRFFASKVTSSFQEIIKHRLYDVDASIREGIDSVFQQVNGILRDVIGQSLAEVDNTINGMLGEVNDVLGAGKVNGYAHIQGDSLKLLRLDLYAQLKVPSEMEFNAFLQIKELDSDGTPAACLPKSGKATEVTFGATDVEIDWISPGMRATATGKFTFDSGVTPPILVNLGGGLELTGELSFETLKIKYLGASMGFGLLENYFSCAARIAVNKYEGMGGLFFGKTCTLDPFFWDKDVQGLLGTPPFTGAYMYAEVWIPISEALLGIPASCFFEVSAGVGAGAGFFVEGPTFIGKMLLGAHGSVLCLVSVGGEVKLVGVKNADGLRLKGTGTLTGEIGPCPFCISFDKSLGLEYMNGNWDVDF